MKTTIKIFIIVLLLLNGTGAIYGGYLLFSDPTGIKMQLPLSYLEHSPFSSYLIPGIVLFIVNGLCSFITLFGVILRWNNYFLLIIAQGFLLGGWILIQMLMLRMFYPPLHLTFLLMGFSLIAGGWYLRNSNRSIHINVTVFSK